MCMTVHSEAATENRLAPHEFPRYLDLHPMKTVRLYAVREDDESNYKTGWRRRTQIVGTILLWAFRAGASRVEFDVGGDCPFSYFDNSGTPINSELPQPPEMIRQQLTNRLFVDTIDGHPLMRPIKRLLRFIFGREPSAKLLVPDSDREVESQWMVRVKPAVTVFELIATVPYKPPWKTQ